MITIVDIDIHHLDQLLARFGIQLCQLAVDEALPGSYWGAPEAGIIKNCLYARPDTPLHSALHESCHYICMDELRRKNLHTNTGGDYDEENAVCYLQILLADHIPDCNKLILCNDMDNWGYTFRLGSAQRWFEEDAEDPLNWLMEANILDSAQQITWEIRH